MTVLDVLTEQVGPDKAAEILDALRAAGFTITADERHFGTWQADH